MRQKYIRKLFNGEIRPAESRGFENEDYENRQNEFTKLYREIQALLPDDKQKKLELLCAHYALRAKRCSHGYANRGSC